MATKPWGRRFFDRLRDGGFTMMELIVAMVVIAIALLVLTGIQISAARSIAEARDRQEATALGNEAMEQMRAIPFNVLSKGLASNFNSASGGDPWVEGTDLKIDGQTTALQIATSSQDQNLSIPWQPLFDGYGSNLQVRTDAANTGVPYSVRAYTTRSASGDGATVGLAVVVSWPDRRGGISHTTFRSEAYRGGLNGCGSLDTQPFLGACQALLASSSSSGSIVTTVSGSSIPSPDSFPVPVLGTGSFYTLQMRSANASAGIDSQQVTIASSYVNYGGSTKEDNLESTKAVAEGWAHGYLPIELDASDNPASSNIPASPTSINHIPSAVDETANSLSDGGSPVSLESRSDFLRPSTLAASSTTGCVTGISGGSPCAVANIANSSTYDGGSGYITMTVEGTIFRLSRRIGDEDGTQNTDRAWAARFLDTPGGSSDVGCQTLTEEGCVSAGANRKMATINIGKVFSSPGKWGPGLDKAGEGIVVIEGRSGCPSGQFEQSVRVQRGNSQKTSATGPSTIFRCGQIRYWSGSDYTPITIDNSTDTAVGTDPVTWTGTDVSVTAVATVTILPVSDVSTGPADCVSDSCVVEANAGSITVNVQYTITWSSGSYVFTTSTVINPPTAKAAFKKAPNA